ncbi:2-amino-4-hydroxy-6-hydroxymethyldihydropteridine diphosphokinase [Tessaracoccus defluvii]|uniref:2-amino-4-hydroxy-6- hydroxymethyldihydropteridine diphosphokinase n=1 Tax=Tessaracoccus defluvii TaxID=1285901 RepID=UPI00387370B3
MEVSPVYQTTPISDIEQPDFLNLVVVAESTLEPLTILDRALAIEANFGRTREVPHGPRTLDIDVIMVGKRVSEDDIELPHPRAHERAFVLVPWHDVDPNGELAGHGPIAELLDEIDTTVVSRRDDVVINANVGF